MTITQQESIGHPLLPYVPRLVSAWRPTGADSRHMRVEGSLAFVDISGFTTLTERLARKGKVGAEEMSDILSATFASLLTEARADGADLVKWGGDAVLLLFQGPDHAQRAARSAYRMRAVLRTAGKLSTTSGAVTLRISVGIHSGDFDFFLVGDPTIHRELLISGPGASLTAEIESAAAAGQIGLSAATAALLPRRLLGEPLLGGRLLRSQPRLEDIPAVPRQAAGFDPETVLPKNIRAHLLSGTGEPEHRPITVAFVQFSGTDALLATDGAEVLAGALDEVVRNVQSACADHDVTFFETDINRDGGKIMLTAGAPRSADHDEERMLRVARLVLDRAGRLPLRIGVNRGHVFSGDFGPEFRRTYSVKGDAVNLAARVMGKAMPGQLMATLDVVDRSQTVFRTALRPPFLVKGKSTPVRAAVIGEALGARHEEHLTGPLVGREPEMAVLRGALDDVRARRGRLVEVVGEPGIGKSRLVEELLQAADDVLVASAPAEEYESSTAYFPFRQLLRGVLGIPADATPDDVARRLVDRVSVNAPHLREWLPLLGVPMDLELEPTRATRELDEQFRKDRLEDVVSDFLSWALPTATVLVFEDAHLMDDASADLARRLAAKLDSCPWLLLVTRRDQERGFVPAPGPAVVTVVPGPLTAHAALQLAQTALDDSPLPRQALDTLAARSGGNPMFLQALIREASQSRSVADLPVSVEALVTSQIDRLDPADRTVLRYAAVLGTVVDEDALLRLLDGHAERPRDGSLDRLSGFLLRESPDLLRFRHTLMRDVAYEGLPFRRRRLLHEQVGAAIEASSPTPDAQCELLSLHFFHAGRYDKAWTYSVLAAERARTKYANGEVIDFFRRAAEAARRHRAVPAAELALVLEGLGDTLFLVGQPQDAAAAYAEARRQVKGDPVRIASIIEKEVRVDQRLRRFSESLRRISLGLRGLDGRTDPAAHVSRSLLARRYAFSRFNQGRVDDALHWADIASREAEDAVDKVTLALAYTTQSFIYATSGRDEPYPYGQLALQVYIELDQLLEQAHCLNNLAVQAFAAGRWDEAREKYQRAADIFRRVGDTASEGNTIYNLVELLVRQRRYAEAATLMPDALRIARAVGDDELVALVLREQAQLLAAGGDLDLAVATLAETRDRFEQLGEPDEIRTTDLVLADVLLSAHRVSDATAALDRILDGLDPATAPGPAAWYHRLAARALADAGAGAGAERAEHLESGLRWAEAADNAYERGMLLGDLAEVRGRQDHPDAEKIARTAAEVLEQLGVEPRA